MVKESALTRETFGANAMRATINDALAAMKVPGNFVHLVMVNNQMERDRGRELADDDELMVMPPVGAG